VDIHHLLAFFLRQLIPLHRFPERVDKNVLVLSRDDAPSAAFAARMFVLVDVHRPLGHTEEASWRRAPFAKTGLQELRGHLGELFEPLTDAPQNEVRIGARADRAERNDQALLLPRGNDVGEFGFAGRVFLVGQAAPFGDGFEKEIVYGLAFDFVTYAVILTRSWHEKQG
jgi:hypothetical protein